MTSSISLSVVGATLPPITLSTNPDMNMLSCNFPQLFVRNKILDNFYEAGDLIFDE